jgi:hypothetical protein
MRLKLIRAAATSESQPQGARLTLATLIAMLIALRLIARRTTIGSQRSPSSVKLQNSKIPKF